MPHCLLIDGNNIVFRAYYAFQNMRLKTTDGKSTGALYGFLRMILKILKDRQPELIAVAFDTSRDTFRRKMYPEYKAKRKPVPQDLLEQLPLAHKAIEALGIKILTHVDYEADDLLGSLARKLENNHEVSIVTGDRDLLQLINGKVTVELCQKGVSEMRKFANADFEAEYGFEPSGIIELKSLMGDSSDNIPGVKGIGEKKGMALVQEYLTIENLYAKIDTVANDKMREKLLADKEMAYLSHDLATIRCDVKTIESIEEIRWTDDNLNSDKFANFLIQYQFTSLYKEFMGKIISGKVLSDPNNISSSDLYTESSDGSELNSISLQQTEQPLPGQRILVQKIEDLELFLSELGDRPLCIDIETSSLNPMDGQIIGVSLAGDYEKSIYVPLRHAYLGLNPDDQLQPSIFFNSLSKKLKNRFLIGHNLKFDLAFLAQEGIEVTGDKLFDTMIAAYVVDPTRSNALKSLGKNLLNFEVEEYKHVTGNKSFAEVEITNASSYACQDVLLTMRLYEYMKNALEKDNLLELFDKIEMPLMCILLDMECTGIGLNSNYLQNLSNELAGKLAQLEESIYDYAKHEFNINSTHQLQKVLFNELGLNPPKKTKTGFSTDSEVLQILAPMHPICADLIEYRELTKLKSTYADALVSLVCNKTGLIHASFNQTVTATGRLSSSNPNMQNIPIKTEWGRKIRRAFLPIHQNDKFVSIDYSQIELRLLAHFSQDTKLIKAFTEETDIHSMTAGHIFKKSPHEVSSSERRVGKTVNFGIIYGISAHGLAQDLAISRFQAKEYIDSFYSSFPEVTKFFDSVVEQAVETGKVETLLGRIRQLPEIASSRFQERSSAERMAKNTRLQGSAADLVKKAMIESMALLRKNNYKSKLILQIHDELVFSVPESELLEVTPLLKNIMETCIKLDVPLVCDVAIGSNLADME